MEHRFVEAAAKKSSLACRYNLGLIYGKKEDLALAKRHWMFGAAAGSQDCLNMIQAMFFSKCATKDEYDHALRSHNEALAVEKTDERDAWLAEVKRRRGDRVSSRELRELKKCFEQIRASRT